MALGWLRWRAWAGVERGDAAAVGVAGVALGDIHLQFAWQAWHLATCIFTLRGRRGTWLRWCAWAGVERGDAAAVGVAGVALGDIHLRFTWQAWYLVTSTSTFAWQAWHVWHWAGSGGALGPGWNALLAWQAWHLVTSTFNLRGRRGTWRHVSSLCVAGVALGDIDRHFAWQAWHLRHWAGSHTIFDTPLCHTPSFTHRLSHTIFHTQLCHTPLCHTPLCHTPLCHTPSLSHTIFHTQLCHTPSFATPLCHTPSFTHHLLHTTLSHTIFHTPSYTHLCHTPSFTHNFVTHHL